MKNSRRATKAWTASGQKFTLSDHAGATKHEQLKNSLTQQIGLLRLQPGDALPSESGLCELYGVSRAVVRQTLVELENAGVIYRVQGKGSFIAEREPPGSGVYTLRGLYADATHSKAVITTEVFTQDYIDSDMETAAALHISPGERVFYLERLRRVNGEPWSWIRSYLPDHYGQHFAKHDMRQQSLHTVLTEIGIIILDTKRSVEVAPATPEEVEVLELGDFPVVMVLTSVSHDPQHQPVEYFRALHRGNRSRIEFGLRE